MSDAATASSSATPVLPLHSRSLNDTLTTLHSPDTQNNNRHHSVDLDANKQSVDSPASSLAESLPKEQADLSSAAGAVVGFDGKVFFAHDGSAYIVDDGAPTQSGETTKQPIGAYHLSAADAASESAARQGGAVVRQFRVHSLRESAVDHARLAADERAPQLIICFACKLSFTAMAIFERHVEHEHQLVLNDDERLALQTPRVSVILQDGAQLHFLECIADEDGATPQSRADQVASPKSLTAEEIAINLRLASELSASRLLKRVSKGALGIAAPPCTAASTGACVSPMDCKSVLEQAGMRSMVSDAALPLMTTTLSTARNSCKTLKCPKCNWHYKYQETLEIHMKEKHPETEVTCAFCLHNRAHPKLSRGETYACGYKPYRCDICKYSTTTKGNLSIHMQSDKHLNNVHELQQGSNIDPNVLIHAEAPQTAADAAARSPSAASPAASAPFRCDVCSYESNVARNLRIHMTSEKHAQNMTMLQQKMAEPPLYGTPAAVTDADFLQLPQKMFQCCICCVFATDCLEQLRHHLEGVDRTQTVQGDVVTVHGNYLCNLCNYKTHLKANFQLHTKTEKHTQRLQLTNHMREGGGQNEWRLRFVNSNSSVQLRCNACLEYYSSWQKLQSHCLSAKHRSFESALEVLQCALPPRHRYVCTVCNVASTEPADIVGHLRQTAHAEAAEKCEDGGETSVVGVRPASVDGDDCSADDGAWADASGALDMTDAVHCCSWCPFTCKSSTQLRNHGMTAHSQMSLGQQQSSTVEGGAAKTVCPLCQSDCGDSRSTLEVHLRQVHNVQESAIQRLLQLLPVQNGGSPPASVAADSTTWTAADSDPETASPPDQLGGHCACPICAIPFGSLADLRGHQAESGHLEMQQTARGPGYLCWHSDCSQYFATAAALQVHLRETHERRPAAAPSACVSERHVYRYRCSECSLAFRTEEKLRAHSVYHMMRASTRCAVCERSFRSLGALRRHVESAHVQSDDTPAADALDDSNRIEAGADDDEANSSVMAEAHYTDADRRFKCHRCKVAYTKQPFLSNHLKSTAHRRNDKNANYGMEKFMDPNRPFKCDICKESFTQKSILLVHFNSVSHLHKTKKFLELQAPSLNLNDEVLKALNRANAQPTTETHSQSTSTRHVKTETTNSAKYLTSPSSSAKPYKCNLCKQSYGQRSTLDIHMRSVAHQSRAAKLMELVASGEVDPMQPLVEQPVEPKQPASDARAADDAHKLAAALAGCDSADATTTAALMNALTMMQMAPLWMQAMQGAADGCLPLPCLACGAAFASAEQLNAHTPLCPLAAELGLASIKPEPSGQDAAKATSLEHVLQNSGRCLGRISNGKTGGTFKRLLEEYGSEVVMQYNETLLQRKRPAPADGDDVDEPTKRARLAIAEASQTAQTEDSGANCRTCGKYFSGLWILKAHIEQVHKDIVPADELDKISDEFKTAYDKKYADSVERDENTSLLSAAPPVSSHNVPAKSVKPKKEAEDRQIANLFSSATSSSSVPMPMNPAPFTPTSGMLGGFGLAGFPFMNSVSLPPFANYPFLQMPMMLPSGLDPSMGFGLNSFADMMQPMVSSASGVPNAPPQQMPRLGAFEQSPRRARTRITDDQLKILREYFDINNSPTEQQIELMSSKSGLPPKVIKHWFRNTLFKERQRNKDSPYNFSVPPLMGIDLDAYEKTGETKVICLDTHEPIDQSASADMLVDVTDTSGKSSEDLSPKQPSASDRASPADGRLSITSDVPDEGAEDAKITTLPDAADILAATPIAQAVAAAATTEQLSAQEALRRLTLPQTAHAPLLPTTVANAFGLLTGMGAPDTPSTSDNADAMTNLIASAMTPSGPASCGPGRRANRTRFTDFQLRTLQDFFEKQAYPKDDDLEFLSKKLGLSPRVIVVWFQNARQKARKIYENQPQADSNDRFIKTPGCNFQCKRCSLVFQRYYELIQHQQKHCYRDEPQQRADEAPADARQSTPCDDDQTKATFTCHQCKITFDEAHLLSEHIKVHAENPLIFGTPIKAESPQGNAEQTDSDCRLPEADVKSEATVVRVQATRARGRSGEARFNKRCPFCGILFHSKSSLETHLPKRHPDQISKVTVHIDALPNADEVPTITTTTLPMGDVAANAGSLAQSMLSLGLLPSVDSTNSLDILKRLAGEADGVTRSAASETASPSKAPSSSVGGASGSDSPGLSIDDNDDGRSSFSYDSPSPRQLSAQHLPSTQGAAGGGVARGCRFSRAAAAKRYRTHLSPMQVQVMRQLFRDYKTPSMAECEQLGVELKLHKRVVQVWFQNARAKERKAKAAQESNGVAVAATSPRASLGRSETSSQHCTFCNVAYSVKQSVQEHIFSPTHIAKIKEHLRAQGTDDTSTSPAPRGVSVDPPTPNHLNHADAQPPAAKNVSSGKKTAPLAAADAAALTADTKLMGGVPMPCFNPAYLGMMYPGGFPNLSMLAYDPSVVGTPVTGLQIPLGVMERITAAMATTSERQCRFTQDGKRFDELASLLTEPDARAADARHMDVGWACRACTTVFQSEALFGNHQRYVCHSSDPAFRLVQTHYHCRLCDRNFGRQVEYQNHCDTAEHASKRGAN